MKTVVTDLDGTLLHRGKIDQESVDILKEFQKKGRLILATGRNLESVKPVCERLKMMETGTGGLILVNGLEVYDFQDGESVASDYIAEEELSRILKTLKSFGMRIRVVRSECGVQKVEMIVPAFGRRITRHLRKILENYEVLQIGKNWIEVLPGGTDKINGLKYFQKKYQIPGEDLYVFGDGENDIKMLQYAEHSYAPENALPAAKKAAGNICGSCKQHGVVQIIKRI